MDCRQVDPSSPDGYSIVPAQTVTLLDFCGELEGALSTVINPGADDMELNLCGPGDGTRHPVDAEVINPDED